MQPHNKNFFLIINTAIPSKLFIAIVTNDRFCKKIKSRGKSDELLLRIDEVLKRSKLKSQDLSGVIVVSGPGSFTAVRQGVVVANTLGFLLKTLVVGLRIDEFSSDDELVKIGFQKIATAKAGEMVLPFYGKEPNITKPRD